MKMEINLGNIKVKKKINIGNLKTGIKKMYPTLENLEVTPSEEKQVFNHLNSYGYNEVIVNKIESEELTITPSVEKQVEKGLFNEVTIEAVENVRPEIIKSGEEILGITGTAELADEQFTESFRSLIDDTLGENITTFPKVSKIGNYAFYGKEKLKNIKLPEGLIEIGTRSFRSCSNLTSIELPDTVQKIGREAFEYCYKLVLKKLPEQLETIEPNAFYNCYELNISEIPEKVKTIGYYAFTQIREVKELTCKFNTCSIGQNAFYKCSNLIKFAMPNLTEIPIMESSVGAFENTPISQGTGYIYVPDELVEDIKKATNWTIYAEQIKGISEME